MTLSGTAALIAPEIMARFTGWFVNQPLLMRLNGVLGTALGTVLALREYREEEPPPPWLKRVFG